ncbi:hypothetical protein ElyMa_006520100 [Elysia marginata]|uniref:Uncharacterized protein n=1 Tax=Elysia marginata TaxID=1093978 RepID=A0AAV4I7D8_9GAST|nr:hypothetical protein ElyMa_006520100 [Elysia marginata]
MKVCDTARRSGTLHGGLGHCTEVWDTARRSGKQQGMFVCYIQQANISLRASAILDSFHRLLRHVRWRPRPSIRRVSPEVCPTTLPGAVISTADWPIIH